MKNQYIDIPVNIRRRIDGLKGYEYAAFYVTLVTFKCDVTEDTKLWDLAHILQVSGSTAQVMLIQMMQMMLSGSTECDDQTKPAPAVC